MKKRIREFMSEKSRTGFLLLQLLLIGVMPQGAQAYDKSKQGILDKKVSINFHNVNYRSALLKIEKVVDAKFMYQSNIIPSREKVNLQLTEETVGILFDRIFTPIDVIYEVDGDQIILTKNELSGSLDEYPNVDEGFMFAPEADTEIRITGRVTDETGAPLPGVNVLVKGTTTGTATDTEGKYSISAIDENVVLVFSFIGYLSQEVSLKGRTTVDISLAPDISSLSEVVVVGYGVQKKSSLVSSISSVSSKDLTAVAVPNFEQALQGRAPGVSVTASGSPGTTPIVRIRGINSVLYASNPMYVVDGIAEVGNFNLFNSKDIESVEILKDANAAAIYGSRASAGVILVTTKKGSRDGFHINIDSYVGVQKAWKTLDLLKRDDYLSYGNALLGNAGAGLPPRFSTMNDPIYVGSTQTFAQTETDWQDEMFRNALITQTDVSISGGNEKSRFYISGGYFKQDGIMLGTSYDRYSLRLNSDHRVHKNISIGQTLFVGYGSQISEQSPGGRTQIQNMMRMTPYIPVLNPTNVGGYGGPTGADASDPQNPVRAAVQDLGQNDNVRILGSVFLEVDILKDLKFRSTIGVDYNSGRNYVYNPIYFEGFTGRDKATISDARSSFFSPIYTNQLTYDKAFGKHSVTALAAIEYQTWTSSNTNVTGNTLSYTAKELTGLENQSFNANKSERALYSYIGRLNYSYSNKYLFSATIRRDGDSNWAPGSKFGTFPSVGLGWVISEENFMSGISSVSELKLRASYGSMGLSSGNLGYYPWQTVINTSNTQIPIGGQLVGGSSYNKLPNTALAWEITNMANVGVDVGLFQNKVTLTAEYFNRVTEDLILGVNPPFSAGYTSSTPTNIGKMTNSGFDFQAGYRSNEGDLKWNLSGNFSVITNTVNALESPKAYIEAGANADFGDKNITRTEAGHAVQSFYGWVTDGIYQNVGEIIGQDGMPIGAVNNLPINTDGTVDLTKYNDPANIGKYTRPGDIRFKDLDNNGTIDPNDRKYLGSFLPKFAYGINFNATYKGFDFTAFFQGVQGNKVYNGTKVIGQGMLRLFNSSTDVLDAWTPTNTDTDVPRAINSDPNGNARTSDRFLEDGSYFRLKNLSIGYALPKSLLQSISANTITNLRVYVSSQNLFTITKYTGYDPEVGSRGAQLTQGIDYGQFPQARTFMFGVQLGF